MRSIPLNTIALFLSGGIDSQVILFSALEAGKTVVAYTFTRDDVISEDFKMAEDVSKVFNISHIPIYLPTDLMSLKHDLLILHNEYYCNKKVEYECFWPFLYTYPKISEHVVCGGFSIEGSLAVSRDYALHYKPNIKLYRDDSWLEINRSQRVQHWIIGNKFNVLPYFPFQDQEIYRLFYESSYLDCNKPKDKSIIIDAFQDYFSKIKIRKPQNLQLGINGIADLFSDKLLNSDWNIHNYKSITGIYNCINRREISYDKQRKRLF